MSPALALLILRCYSCTLEFNYTVGPEQILAPYIRTLALFIVLHTMSFM